MSEADPRVELLWRSLATVIDPEIGLGRLQSRDRLDGQPLEFHRRVRDGFLREAAAQPLRWVVLDASAAVEQVAAAALAAIRAHVEDGSRTGAVD